MTGKAGPIVHFEEQLGDFQVGQQPVRSAHQRVGFRRHSAVEGGELEARTADGRIRQLVLRREPFHRLQLALQHGRPRLQEPLTVGLHRQAQCLLLTLCRETRRRQEVLLEVFELARAPYPDIAGAQRILEFREHAQLVEPAIQNRPAYAPDFSSVWERRTSARRLVLCALVACSCL